MAGQVREVQAEGSTRLHRIETYSIPETSKALGKGELTLKRWIEEGLIPEPVLSETSRGYRQYSVGELEIVADVLVQHSRQFSYYAKNHTNTREEMHERVQEYRRRHFRR